MRGLSRRPALWIPLPLPSTRLIFVERPIVARIRFFFILDVQKAWAKNGRKWVGSGSPRSNFSVGFILLLGDNVFGPVLGRGASQLIPAHISRFSLKAGLECASLQRWFMWGDGRDPAASRQRCHLLLPPMASAHRCWQCGCQCVFTASTLERSMLCVSPMAFWPACIVLLGHYRGFLKNSAGGDGLI